MSSSVLSNGVVELEVIGLTTGTALAFQLAEAPELVSVDTGVLSLAPAGLRISSLGAFSPFTKPTYFTKFSKQVPKKLIVASFFK